MTSLSNDPRFGELIGRFIESLPDRVREMRDQLAAGDAVSVRQLAHRLKGAGGSYGYPRISGLARRIEALCDRGASAEDVVDAVERLGEEADRLACVTA